MRIWLGRSAALAAGVCWGSSGASAQWRAETPRPVEFSRATQARSTTSAPSNIAQPRGPASGGPDTTRLQPVAHASAPRSSVVVNAQQAEQRPKLTSFRTAVRSLVTGRRIVAFDADYPPGAIVVANRERALYHVGPDRTAVRYPVAIGSAPEEWTGLEFITDKKINPPWHPVPELGKDIREPVLGGDPTNPLGPRALYLGRTLWRIHGTPFADSIGRAVSNGCIRMHNEHVVELYENVLLGTEVYVIDSLADPKPTHRGRKAQELANTNIPRT